MNNSQAGPRAKKRTQTKPIAVDKKLQQSRKTIKKADGPGVEQEYGITIEDVHARFCKHNKLKYSVRNLEKDLMWQCFAVATVLAIMLRELGVDARAVYGVYTGPDYRNHPLSRHGWVVINNKYVSDPTRWVFEQAKPYIYATDTSNQEYDEGMRSLRQSSSARRFIPRKPTDKLISLNWSEAAASYLLQCIMPPDFKGDIRKLTYGETLWIGGFDYLELAPVIDEVYEVLIKAGQSCAIPHDYKEWQQATKKMRQAN
jgi:hypothetical protein